MNKSKRQSVDGRPCWSSTELLANTTKATNSSLEEFLRFAEPAKAAGKTKPWERASGMPLLGFAQTGTVYVFDDSGFPVRHGWELIELPARKTHSYYVLRVHGDSMLPLYRNGDALIVDPGATVRNGYRVVVKTILER